MHLEATQNFLHWCTIGYLPVLVIWRSSKVFYSRLMQCSSYNSPAHQTPTTQTIAVTQSTSFIYSCKTSRLLGERVHAVLDESRWSSGGLESRWRWMFWGHANPTTVNQVSLFLEGNHCRSLESITLHPNQQLRQDWRTSRGFRRH